MSDDLHTRGVNGLNPALRDALWASQQGAR